MAGDWLGLLLHCCLHDDLRDSPDWELQPHLEDVRELQQVHGLPASRQQELLLPLQRPPQPLLSSSVGLARDVEMFSPDPQVVSDCRVERLAPAELIN